MSQLIAQAAPATCYQVNVSDGDLQALDQRTAVKLLFLMHMTRAFEERVLDLKEQELVHGPAHTSVGQEAVAAAVAAVLDPIDMIASTHRAHGHFLSKALVYYAPQGFDPLTDSLDEQMQNAVYRTLAEIMGLAAGWCGGRGGSMHLYDATSGNLGSNAIVGGGIPLATGVAWAQALQDTGRLVVSFFGDGAINQGCFHEVANMAALWRAPVVYLVENNLYAVGTCTTESSNVRNLGQRTLGYGFDSYSVDGMDPLAMYTAVQLATARIRANPGPLLIEAKTYRHYHHAGRIKGSAFGYRSSQEEQDWLARDPLQTFPARLAAVGLVPAEANQRIVDLTRESIDRATALCIETVDGKWTIPVAHWPNPATAATNVRSNSGLADVSMVERKDIQAWREITYVQAIASTTLANMRHDERIIVLGEEVGNLRGGAYAATRGIKEFAPERLINTPISETGFVGMAGGLASVGMRPIVEVMFPDFALMASDQLFNQIGKLRHMYDGQVSFPLVVRTRIATGFGYGGQHSMDPSALFALFSGWRILAPATPFECIGLLNTALRLKDPVLLVEHGQLYGLKGPVPETDDAYCVAYGKARIVKEGNDLTVLTYLKGVHDCNRVALGLEADGISVEVIDLRTLDLVGMDYATIGRSIAKTGAVLVMDESPHSLSLSGRIAAEVSERFFDDLDCPVMQLTALDVPPPVSKRLEEATLPSLQQIDSAMRRGAEHSY